MATQDTPPNDFELFIKPLFPWVTWGLRNGRKVLVDAHTGEEWKPPEEPAEKVMGTMVFMDGFEKWTPADEAKRRWESL